MSGQGRNGAASPRRVLWGSGTTEEAAARRACPGRQSPGAPTTARGSQPRSSASAFAEFPPRIWEGAERGDAGGTEAPQPWLRGSQLKGRQRCGHVTGHSLVGVGQRRGFPTPGVEGQLPCRPPSPRASKRVGAAPPRLPPMGSLTGGEKGVS